MPAGALRHSETQYQRTMKRFGQIGAGVAAALLCFSCGEKPYTGGGTSGSAAAEQHFIVAVESMGELFTGGEGVDVPVATRRPISSVAPTQTFDLLSIIIVEYASPARVVFKRTIGSWSSPDNMASIPWSLESGQGRYATVTLSGDECLEEGHTYMAYVIGYQSGTFGGYEPFRDFEVGDVYNRTEVASVPAGGSAEEIFAGAELFEVRDGAILSGRGNGTTVGQGVLVARRQVAGTFGYFTRIPVRVSGRDVAALRLVATRRNRSLIFGGFRGLDDLFDFSKDNVINGMNPRTDYDARLAGSSRDDAFVVYRIDLCKWFPGNAEQPLLPFDANGDGYLDDGDDNWQMDAETYPQGTISLPQGTVFGEKFWISVAMTHDDVVSGTPTFQMQLLDAAGAVVTHWDVALRDFEGTDRNRTLVSLPDGPEGRTLVTHVENLDTETCFSIVRNRLYTMGEKSQSQSYGEDVPVDLSAAGVLVLNANHQWQIQNSIIFN